MRVGSGVRRAVVVACLLVALVLAGLGVSSPAGAEDEVEFSIDDPQITESSGLAADPAAGHYWTVNDSGDEARVFAVGPDGQTLGQVGFRADVTDVEALARTPDGLYVADIGDNGAERDSITVYRLAELGLGGTSLYSAWDLTYADGGARDAEAIAVTSGGDLLVITKEADGGVWTTAEPLTAAGTNTLQRIGDAPPFVTDATVLPDGRVVVRSYLSVSVLDPVSFEVQASAALPLQPQGESLTTSLDGGSLLVGSEGADSQVLRVPVPATVTEDLPEAPSEAPADSPSAGSPPSTSAPPPGGQGEGDDAGGGAGGDEAGGGTDEGPGSGVSRRGTAVAIGLAALLALGAGAVVAMVGRGRAAAAMTGDEAGTGDGPGSGGAPDTGDERSAVPGPGNGSDGAGSDDGVVVEDEPASGAEGLAAADTDPGATASTDAGATPASGTQPSGVPEAGYVRSEDGSGRVTWSEPAEAEGVPGTDGPPDHGRDLDWLYENRDR